MGRRVVLVAFVAALAPLAPFAPAFADDATPAPGASASPAPSASASAQPTPAAAPTCSPSLAAQLLGLVNSHRASHHYPALRADSALAAVACRHTLGEVRSGVLQHDMPLFSRASHARLGIAYLGENVCWDYSVADGHKAFLSDSAHHSILDDPRYRLAGFAVVVDGPRFWMTEDFGTPRAAAAARRPVRAAVHPAAPAHRRTHVAAAPPRKARHAAKAPRAVVVRHDVLAAPAVLTAPQPASPLGALRLASLERPTGRTAGSAALGLVVGLAVGLMRAARARP